MNHLFQIFRNNSFDPKAPCLETEDGQIFTYGDMLAESGRFANSLTRLGVVAGDRVAVSVEKCPEALWLYLACIRTGAVFLPLNPAYAQRELDYFFRDAEPRLVVCSPSKLEAITAIARGEMIVETLGPQNLGSLAARTSNESPDFEDRARAQDDLAAILYTSGTTGRSKGAMLTHGNLASNAVVLANEWQFSRQDILVHALPIFHTHGLFVACHVVMTTGASMLWHSRFDPAAVLPALERATAFMGVPTFYVRLLEQAQLSRQNVSNMRLFVSGSAPLLPETFEAWRERTGHTILERYGMTETGMNTTNPYIGERIAGTVGFPLPGVDIRVSDPETGRVLADDQVGMIEVRGPNIFKGYWRMPEKTAEEFRPDGYFVTGDLGKIDERGYVHIVGRGKDLIISGGLNVYPREVEAEIDLLTGVKESAVIGLPHSDFGEAVTAMVVLENGAARTEDELLQQLRDTLARFKQPKRVLFLDELPRNAMGKVQKAMLRDTYRTLFHPDNVQKP